VNFFFVLILMQPNYFKIPQPCSEDWNQMDGTEQGAFCVQCSKEVLDLTQISSTQVKDIIQAKSNPCIRILKGQIDEMNWIEWFNSLRLRHKINYLFLFSFLFVFHFGGTAQENDTLIKIIPPSQIPADSTKKDSSTVAAPIEIFVKGPAYDQSIATIRALEEEILMGIPPLERPFESIQMLVDFETIEASPRTIGAKINSNFLICTIENDEVIVNVVARQEAKLEIRLYNHKHELIFSDFLRIHKGSAELRYLLEKVEAGPYSIELISPSETITLQVQP